MEPIVKRWLAINHPHLQLDEYFFLTETKISVKCSYLDNSDTKHGHGSCQIVNQNFIVNIWDILE